MKVQFANYLFPSDNIGDAVQVYALENIYCQMGIAKDDIVHLTRENACELIKNDTHYILPLVTGDQPYYDFIEFLIEHKLEDRFSFVPLSLGQTRWTFLDEDGLAKFRHVINKFILPIGCRDYDVASMYGNLGYPVYINGCITNTLLQREKGEYNKVYLIDIPSGFSDYIPQELLSRSVYLTQIVESLSAEQLFELCKERYELLRNTASLVITCRYHVATPCCAMGIPVIMIENCDKRHHWTFDPRLSAMNPCIPFYTKDQWSEIDWVSSVPQSNYEEIRRTITELTISRIRNVAEIVMKSNKLSLLFKPSKERFWNEFSQNKYRINNFSFSYYIDKLFLSKIEGDFQFYLYGLSNRYIEQNRCVILDCIKNTYPKAEFLGFVDSMKRGSYFGKEVIMPDEMKMNENTYCLVSAYTANDFAIQLFEKQKFDKTHLWIMPQNVLFWVYHQ